MIRTYLLLAALGFGTAACGGQGEANKAAATGDTGAGETASVDDDAPVRGPDLLTGPAGPDGVVAGGAIDVLRREGWRVAGQPAAAPPPTGATPG